jgi:hypothetical protein
MTRNSKLNQRSFFIFLITALGLNLLTPALASAETPKPKEVKASCRIEIDNAHISASLLKNRKLKYLKVNARSICNVYQQRVTLTVEIYKTGKLSNQLVRSFATKEGLSSSSGFVVKMNNAVIRCRNTRETAYYGIAYAKALINGKWQYAGRTYSKSIILLDCGT